MAEPSLKGNAMFKEQTGDGADAFDAVQAIREIREVHKTFQEWLCANMAPGSSNDFSAEIRADGVLTVHTIAGPVVADLEFIQTDQGPAGRVVFYEAERKTVGLPARAVFAVRIAPDFEVFSGDAGGHKWSSRENGWKRPEAVRLGYEILLGQLKPRQ